jgi:ABC-2 type transport system permease protein
MAIAVLIASVLNEGEYVLGVANLLIFVLFFVTGYNGISPSTVPEPLTFLINYAPNSLATRLTIYHLTPVGSGGALSPPPLPTDPIYLVLLAGYAIGIAVIASMVMRRYIYAGDRGE